jgi:hypothetical protein
MATFPTVILALKSSRRESVAYLAIFVCTTGKDNVIATANKSRINPIRVLDTIFFTFLIAVLILVYFKFILNRQRTAVFDKNSLILASPYSQRKLKI